MVPGLRSEKLPATGSTDQGPVTKSARPEKIGIANPQAAPQRRNSSQLNLFPPRVVSQSLKHWAACVRRDCSIVGH